MVTSCPRKGKPEAMQSLHCRVHVGKRTLRKEWSTSFLFSFFCRPFRVPLIGPTQISTSSLNDRRDDSVNYTTHSRFHVQLRERWKLYEKSCCFSYMSFLVWRSEGDSYIDWSWTELWRKARICCFEEFRGLCPLVE